MLTPCHPRSHPFADYSVCFFQNHALQKSDPKYLQFHLHLYLQRVDSYGSWGTLRPQDVVCSALKSEKAAPPPLTFVNSDQECVCSGS